MSYQFPDIPDSDEELAGWLSRKLVSAELGEFVAELRVVSDVNGTAQPSLNETLGSQRDEVLAVGLGALPQESLRTLLRHPVLMLELQERVLTEGGEYWSKVLSENEMSGAMLQRGKSRLHEFLDGEASASVIVPSQPLTQQRWFVAAVTAVAVLLLVLIYNKVTIREPDAPVHTSIIQLPVDNPITVPTENPIIDYSEIAPPAWGWATANVLPTDGTGEEYFYVLADLAEEWFDERPGDSLGIAKRITEFRQGCSILMLSEHKPLMEADRKWLLRSCRRWADELDAHLADLEDQKKDMRRVRDEMDFTVEIFVDRLRDWGPIAKRRESKK